jgi:hypothetical protein
MVVGAKLNSRTPFIVGLTRQILELNIKDIKVTTARDFSTIFHSFAQIINQYLVPPPPYNLVFLCPSQNLKKINVVIREY